jgi:serine/threonine-protein kinase HipA
LKVPAVRRIYVPQPVYIVERFDRTRASVSNEVQRRHVIDTCQLLNKARTFKYTAANLDSLAQTIELCRFKAAARVQLYNWLIFNILAGNADNHLKNISFLVDSAGINLAPAYDLLCTAVYDTKALANERAHWPVTKFVVSLDEATTFADVTRSHALSAGRALGLAAATAQRQHDRLIKAVPTEAAKLIDKIHAELEHDIAASPDPTATRNYVGGEMRMLDAARHVVVNEMAKRLA